MFVDPGARWERFQDLQKCLTKCWGGEYLRRKHWGARVPNWRNIEKYYTRKNDRRESEKGALQIFLLLEDRPNWGRVGCYVLFNKSFMRTFLAFVFSATKPLQVLRSGCVWFSSHRRVKDRHSADVQRHRHLSSYFACPKVTPWHSKHSQGLGCRARFPIKPRWWNLAHLLGFSSWGIMLLAVLCYLSNCRNATGRWLGQHPPFCRGNPLLHF